jgi:hypothetical protein
MNRATCGLLGLILAVSAAPSCSKDDNSGGGNGYPENAGHPCQTPADCYPGVDAGALQGDVVCMDRVPDGYCTHLCVTDADCCAVPGECDTRYPQVCAPFESAGDMYCFLSCEDTIVGTFDPTTYCMDFADQAFGCRSTGGGSQNRKVCTP